MAEGTWLYISHGDIETNWEAVLLDKIRKVIEGSWRTTRGSNDETAHLAAAGDVRKAVALLEIAAPAWWEWTTQREERVR